MGGDQSRNATTQGHKDGGGQAGGLGASSSSGAATTGVSTSPGLRRRSAANVAAIFKANGTCQGTQCTMMLSDFMDKLYHDAPAVGQLIFSFMSQGTGVTLDEFVTGARRILSGDGNSSLVDFYFKLMAGQAESLSTNEIRGILAMCCKVDLLCVGIPDALSTSDHVLDAVCESIFSSNERTVSLLKFQSWCSSNCPLLFQGLHSFICSRLKNDDRNIHSDDVAASSTVSQSALVTNCRSGRSVGSLSVIWLLSGVLGPNFFPMIRQATVTSDLMRIVHEDGWHVVYDSASDGLSISRFQHHVMDYHGATLMFVAFTNFVYLIAIDCPWMDSSKRWGGEQFMLIQLLPNFKIHQRGSGLMYFNMSDRSVPKGIIIGRDRSIFLKIDGELEKVNHYGVDVKLSALEIWGCGGKLALDTQLKHKAWEKNIVTKEQNRKLVPDDWKDSVDRQLLEMGGVKTDHSERTDI